MTTINLQTATKQDIITLANNDKSLFSFLGGQNMIANRDTETLVNLTEMWFALNTEVGAFYDKNGF